MHLQFESLTQDNQFIVLNNIVFNTSHIKDYIPNFLNADVATKSLVIPFWCTIIQLFCSPLLNYKNLDDI